MMKSSAGHFMAFGVVGALTMGCGAVDGSYYEGAAIDAGIKAAAGGVDGSGTLGRLKSALRPNAGPNYVNCSTSKQLLIGWAYSIVYNRLWSPWAPSHDFLQCMKNGIMSATGTYPEQMLRLLQENIPTNIVCSTEGGANHVPGPESGPAATEETIFLGPDSFASAAGAERDHDIPQADILAELIIHELTHTKGNYLLPRGNGHPGPERLTSTGPCAEGCIERQMAVTNLVTSCLFDNRPMDWNAPDEPPNSIPLRTEMAKDTGEVLLAPVGTIVATEPGEENFCTTNEVGVGIRGRADSHVPSLAMMCREGQGPVRGNDRTGAVAGTGFSWTCPDDEVLVGLSGRAGYWLDAVTPVCAQKSAVKSGTKVTQSSPPSFGGSGGGTFMRKCPPQHVVKGLRLRYTDVITRMDVVCQRIARSVNGQIVDEPLSDARTALLPMLGEGSAAAIDDEHCPSKSVMDKLWAVTEDGTNRLLKLGAGCSKVTALGTGQGITVHSGQRDINHMLPFRGRRLIIEGTGVGRTRECAESNSVLVGLRTEHGGGSIHTIRGVCTTDASAWSRGTGAPETAIALLTVTAKIGATQGTTTQQQQVCPVGTFMTGWRIAEEPNVTTIQPRCRAF